MTFEEFMATNYPSDRLNGFADTECGKMRVAFHARDAEIAAKDAEIARLVKRHDSDEGTIDSEIADKNAEIFMKDAEIESLKDRNKHLKGLLEIALAVKQ